MKKETTLREIRLDKSVAYTLFISLGSFVAMQLVAGVAGFNALWSFVVLAAGLVTSTVFILVKGALTGKRYMQGAKHRREKWFPFLFRKNESLADEAFKAWDNP